MSSKNEKAKKELGEKLRTLRESKGLSLRALAAEADTDHSQIHRIEIGQISPSIVTLQSIADALGVTLCDFFDCKK